MRNLTIMTTLLLAVGYAGSSDAADDLYVHSFEKIQLSDVFYSEGANFGDFNHDGAMDIVAGSGGFALFVRELPVGGGGRMKDQ